MSPRLNRPAQINGAWLAFLASVLILGVLIALLVWDPSRWFTPKSTTRPLVVYCAAGIKKPVEVIAREYEEQFGVPVHLQYGGSQTLLAGIEVSHRGDLYLPGDDSYLLSGRAKGLIEEVIPLAHMRLVLAVRKGNPKNLHSLDNMLKREVRISLANPDAAAVGKLTRTALRKDGHWEAFLRKVVVHKPTVNDVANDIAVGAADAGIIWDVTARQYPDLEIIPLPILATETAHISVGVLHDSNQPTAALQFARFLAARDRGLVEFQRSGFEVVEGDRWAETPELQLMAGAMLRPAVEETIRVFQEREGVRVRTVYNGCGILVAQMKAQRKGPDAYFACDSSFMTLVRGRFQEPIILSTNQLVILVQKGNPLDIRALEDLGKPGLRVGVGHEKQCAMGALTQKTLKQGGTLAQVMKNVKVQSPTGDLLVNQMRAGSLDAVIAYVSNAATSADVLEAIPIDIPCAIAAQPIAIGRDSECQHLTARLVDALRGRQSRERFESFGFHWQVK